MKYLFIPIRGEIKVITTPSETVPSIDFFYDTIGCESIEVVHTAIRNEHLIVVDECGKICEPQKEINPRASILYGAIPVDYICGDVLVGKMGYTPEGPDIVGLTYREINFYLEFFQNINTFFN